jgi:hypothetical protein
MPSATRTVIVLAAALGLVAAAAAPRALGSLAPKPAASLVEGPRVAVGNGTAHLFVERGPRGEPSRVGIALAESALTGLATRMNTTSRCFDKNGDGRLAHGECLGDYQAVLAVPAEAAGLGLPVRWATVNWNPEGHLPPAPHVWSAPHFDFHFFIADRELIEGIRPGPCAEIIHCDDFARASAPLPRRHVPEGYIDVGAAVSAMGNHLVDSRDPELADSALGFSGTFIYGTYDGRMIFLEPMVSHAFLSSRPDRCTQIRNPAAFATAGYYPTSYCVRYNAATASYLVTLEGLVYRQAG